MKNWASIIFVFLLLLMENCNDPNQLEDPVDACEGKTPVIASFTIYENVSDSLFVADTVLQYNTIVFSADESYTTYEWTVGDDPRTFTDKKFHLNFQEPVGKINVTLKVAKKPDLSCFPDDDGVDALSKSLVVIDWRNSLTIGDYQGHNLSNPAEQFEVRITREFDVNNHAIYNLININKGCETSPFGWSGGRGAKVFRFYDYVWYGDGCKGVECWITLPQFDSIRIDYSYGDDTRPYTPQGYPRIQDTYIGKRKTP